MLEAQSVDERLQAFQTTLAAAGKMRVQQVIATEKHHVIVLMAAQADGGLSMHDITVEEDYPHKISAYSVQPLGDNLA
jgi:hypothetical protein